MISALSCTRRTKWRRHSARWVSSEFTKAGRSPGRSTSTRGTPNRIGMVERGQDFRFPLEPDQSFRTDRDRLGQDLDGDFAFQPRVGCAVHLAHATRANLGGHEVWTDARARDE